MVAPIQLPFKSYAQAGQDIFCATVLDHKREGFFLEVGSNNPVEINNTYALEKYLDWRGLGVDNNTDSMLAFEKHRVSPFYFTDASKPQNWIAAIRQAYELAEKRAGSPLILDYLSADIDGETLSFLHNFPLEEVRFRVITAEHDFYRNGSEYRTKMLSWLERHGYVALCSDVMDQGLSFEAWFVDPKLVDMRLAEKFRRTQPTEWREFFT